MRLFLSLFLIAGVLSACSKSSKSASQPQEQDRGGGNFTVALFWQKVESEIIPEVKTAENLSSSEKEELLKLMDKKVVIVSLSDEQLYLMENQQPVDAVNYPSQRKIELYQSAWNDMLTLGLDVNHLILHEFLGLAKIKDDGHGISRKIFPATKLRISFDSDKVECEVAGKFLLRTSSKGKENWFIRDMPPELKSVSLREKDETKSATVEMPVVVDSDIQPETQHIVKADIYLINTLPGARAYERPKLQIIWSLYEKTSSNEMKLLSIMQTSTESRDDMSDKTTLFVQIPISQFAQKLAQNGFPLELTQYERAYTDMFHSYNVAGFLEQKTTEYSVDAVLKGLPHTSPFRIWAGCSLLAP